MESVTYLRNIKIAPKKLRLIIPQIKRLRPAQALSVLLYTPKKPAKILYKAVRSALFNAKQALKVNEDLLQFKVLSVDEGQKLKRYNPGSRGTTKPYAKKFSHIKIVMQLTSAKSGAQSQEKPESQLIKGTKEQESKRTAKQGNKIAKEQENKRTGEQKKEISQVTAKTKKK